MPHAGLDSDNSNRARKVSRYVEHVERHAQRRRRPQHRTDKHHGEHVSWLPPTGMHRKTEMEALHQLALAGFPSLGRPLRKVTHAADEALSLSRRDHAARIQQVEDVACLQRLLIRRQG